MPRSLVPTQGRSAAGVVVAPGAIDQPNGMYIAGYNQSLRLHITNSAGSSKVATINALPCPKCGVTTNKAVTIAAAAEAVVENLTPATFIQADGSVTIDFAAGFTGTIYAEPPL